MPNGLSHTKQKGAQGVSDRKETCICEVPTLGPGDMIGLFQSKQGSELAASGSFELILSQMSCSMSPEIHGKTLS